MPVEELSEVMLAFSVIVAVSTREPLASERQRIWSVMARWGSRHQNKQLYDCSVGVKDIRVIPPVKLTP